MNQYDKVTLRVLSYGDSRIKMWKQANNGDVQTVISLEPREPMMQRGTSGLFVAEKEDVKHRARDWSTH